MRKWYGWLILILVIILLLSLVDNNDHTYHNTNNPNQYNTQYENASTINNTQTLNTERALTDEEAENLRGTGYHNTRSGSSAESIEIQAAKVKCVKCEMRSHNGLNSMCDSCLKKEGLLKSN